MIENDRSPEAQWKLELGKLMRRVEMRQKEELRQGNPRWRDWSLNALWLNFLLVGLALAKLMVLPNLDAQPSIQSILLMAALAGSIAAFVVGQCWILRFNIAREFPVMLAVAIGWTVVAIGIGIAAAKFMP